MKLFDQFETLLLVFLLAYFLRREVPKAVGKLITWWRGPGEEQTALDQVCWSTVLHMEVPPNWGAAQLVRELPKILGKLNRLREKSIEEHFKKFYVQSGRYDVRFEFVARFEKTPSHKWMN